MPFFFIRPKEKAVGVGTGVQGWGWVGHRCTGLGSAATHLFGLLFPRLLLGEELQVELLLLLLVIFLQLREQEGGSCQELLGAKPVLLCQGSCWHDGSSTNRARQGERSDLFSVSQSVGIGRPGGPGLHPAPPES